MSISRASFVEAYRVLNLAANNPATYDSQTNPDHDICAKLFRRNLAVAIFATLESFIKDRTNEILTSIDHQRLNFAELPEGIQKAATVGAIKALNFRLQLIEKSQKQSYAISEILKIASVGTSSYHLSGLSFGHEKSNIAADEIENILLSFRIESPWAKIKIIAGRVGFGGAASYEEVYKNIAARRHSSAHTTTAMVTRSDIADSLPLIYAIAISFDLLISRCLHLLKSKDVGYLTAARYSLDPNALPFARIDFLGNKWKYKASSSARKAIKCHSDRELLFNEACDICRRKEIALVEFGANGQPTRWFY